MTADVDPRAALQARERQLRAELDAVREALAALDKAGSYANQPGYAPVRQGDFFGMKIADAVVKYLTIKGTDATYEELVEQLSRGGANLGEKTERYERNLRIAVRMNSQKSHHPLSVDDKAGKVSLRENGRARRVAG